jgi:hypothetical protein
MEVSETLLATSIVDTFCFLSSYSRVWVLFDLRARSEWSLPAFLFIILYPINLFIFARILFPASGNCFGTDFKVFYFENFKKYFTWAVILIALSIADNILFNGYTLMDQLLQIGLLVFLLFFIYRNFQQEWLHKLTVVLLTVLLFGSLYWIPWTLAAYVVGYNPSLC